MRRSRLAEDAAGIGADAGAGAAIVGAADVGADLDVDAANVFVDAGVGTVEGRSFIEEE